MHNKSIAITAAKSSKDLGVDFACGRRRSTAVIDNRIGKARDKASKAHTLAKQAGLGYYQQYTRLTSQSVDPAMLYGASVAGLSVRQLQRTRSVQALSLGIKSTQQCVTASLALVGKDHADPGIAVRVATVFQWLQLMHAPEFMEVASSRAWTAMVEHLRHSSSKWSTVAGPMGATIVTLLELGWQPSSITSWTSDAGDRWEVSPLVAGATRANCHQILVAVRDSATRLVWQQAAQHRCSDDLVGVPDLAPPRALLADYAKEGRSDKAAMLIKVVAGGLWPPTRWREAQLARRSGPL